MYMYSKKNIFRGQGVAMCEILGGVAIFLSPSIVYLVGFLMLLNLMQSKIILGKSGYIFLLSKYIQYTYVNS